MLGGLLLVLVCHSVGASVLFPFVTRWNISQANDLLTLPLNQLVAPLSIDWGDGTSDGFMMNTTNITHMYVLAGYYNVSISGELYGFGFNFAGDASKLISIESWGDSFMMDSSSINTFAGCVKLTTFPGSSQPRFWPGATAEGMFMNTAVDVTIVWNMLNVTSLESFLSGATKFNQQIIMTNTLGITTTSSMLAGCTRFNQILLLQTDNVVSMYRMFRRASSFNQLLDFNTGKVQDMEDMFMDATAFNQPLNFDTKKVEKMRSMFENAVSFNQPLNFSSTSLVEEMQSMFDGAAAFNQPVNFNTNLVQEFGAMFQGATSFNQPVNFATGQAQDMTSMFKGASSFNQPVPFNTLRVGSVVSMFEGASAFNQAVSFDVRSMTSLRRMFFGAGKMNQLVNLSNTGNLLNLDSMFEGAVSFNQPFTISRADNLTSTRGMFKGAINFNNLVVLTNSTKLQSTASMFHSATRFNQTLNIASTAKITDMSFMFYSLDTYSQNYAQWETSSVTNCTEFCFRCGLPLFPNCAPCSQPVKMLSMSKSMYLCNCPIGEPSSSPTLCGNGPSGSPLVVTWNISGPPGMPQQLLIVPTVPVSSFIVDWGDGQAQAVPPLALPVSSFVNVYRAPGLYNVSFLGRFGGFRFDDLNTAAKLIAVTSWGNGFTMDNTSLNVFAFCVNLRTLPPANTQPVMAPGTTLEGMFMNTSVNSALAWSLINVTSLKSMFANATRFNQWINLTNTQGITSTASMFDGATSFDYPITLLSQRLTNVDFMFKNAVAFNSLVQFPNAFLTSSRGMFAGAFAFNQRISFQANALVSADQMFAFARSFNQPLNWTSTSEVTSMDRMFEGAISFNQPIAFIASSLASTNFMFRGATSFNQPVALLNSTQLRSTAGMFLDATSFNQTVTIDSTASVADMSYMFWNAVGFEQNLGNWDTAAVQNCTPFCFRCGLPQFPNCAPCAPSPRLTRVSKNVSLCNCPANEPKSSTTKCGTGPVCDPTQVVTSLQVECVTATLPPTPIVTGPTPSIFLSPLYNITETTNSSNGSFVFTLPINAPLATERGMISQSCFGEEIKCEWQDPDTLEFRQSGCAVSQNMVDMGSGLVGTECTCTHLTVFAIVLRSNMKLTPLCHAQEIDYVLIALYAVLALVLVVQIARLVKYQLARISTLQHSLLTVVCILRIVYLVAKPVISSLAGLVLLGLLPSAMALSLFIHLLLAWASLQTGALQTSPFRRFRIPFISIVCLVFLLTLVMVILVAAVESVETQQEVVRDGSYMLAALYAAVCVLVLLSGLGLRRVLAGVGASTGSDRASAKWREMFRIRVLVATLGLSGSLFTAACLWVAAVQTDILASSSATLATTGSFYVCDWLSLCVMTWLFSKAIRRKETTSHRSDQSSKHSELTARA